jgi:hypothetical protein
MALGRRPKKLDKRNEALQPRVRYPLWKVGAEKMISTIEMQIQLSSTCYKEQKFIDQLLGLLDSIGTSVKKSDALVGHV